MKIIELPPFQVMGHLSTLNLIVASNSQLGTKSRIVGWIMHHKTWGVNGHSLSTELGFVQKVGSSSDLFFRATNNRFHDIGATHGTFGLKNAEADSWTLGYSTHGKLGNFAWGVSKANQLSKVAYLLLRPLAGLGQEIFFTLNNISQFMMIKGWEVLCLQLWVFGRNLTFGIVEDQNDYGSVGAAKLNFSMQF